MKTFTIATIAALATVGTAQLSNIPQCALTCFVPALTSDGCKDLTDFKCHCEKGAQLVGTVTPCVQGACSAADQATAIEAVQKTCAGVGVPINLPDPAGAASSAAAPAASSAAAVVSSAAEAASSAVASAVSSAAAAVSSAAAAPTSNTTLPSASVSAPLSTFTGAAAQATQAVGLLGAAALAMLAL